MSAAIDIGGALLVVVNLLLGWRFGLLRRVFALLGLFGAVGAATLTGDGIARFVHGSGDPGALYADALAFIAVAGFAMLLVEIVGFLYADRISQVASLVFDRSAGAAVGAFVGLLQTALVCLVVLAVGRAEPAAAGAALPSDRSSYASDVQASLIGGRVHDAETGLLNVFKPVLPTDLPSHLADSATRQ